MDGDLRDRLFGLFLSGSPEAFRAFFHLEERLAEEARDEEARALSDELWRRLDELPVTSDAARARLFHDFAVFLGAPGPAAHLLRARKLFAGARASWEAAGEESDVARSLHNEANALVNLGSSAEDLAEAIGFYERALLFRTEARAIARSVTLHNMGTGLRRLAEVSPEPAPLLLRSEEALLAAIAIREAEGLAEGLALSLFQLGLTREASARAGRAGAGEAAREAFEAAAEAYERIGRAAEADVARRCALGVASGRPAG
ncbi:MAG TPA: hypothetical protein VKF32_08590 [Thermoanaerobaculia bacterium]|nr:hypothetical protein [Thermoanaerobaculia bacterium]